MSTLPECTPSSEHPALSVCCRGLADYTSTWREMQSFTDTRTAESPDELWLLPCRRLEVASDVISGYYV